MLGGSAVFGQSARNFSDENRTIAESIDGSKYAGRVGTNIGSGRCLNTQSRVNLPGDYDGSPGQRRDEAGSDAEYGG